MNTHISPSTLAAFRRTVQEREKMFNEGIANGSIQISNEKLKESRVKWNHRDWEKYDPEGLKKIKNEFPLIAQEMYNNQYK